MSESGEVRVGVAAGRELVRAGLLALLQGQEGLAVTASFASTGELLSRRQSLDVLVLDPELGDERHLAAHVAHARALGARVLALVDAPSGARVRLLAAAGVRGVVPQAAERRTFIAAVIAAARHSGPSFTVWSDTTAVRDVADAGLSPGEREVLALYAAGLKADAVARAVGLSASTVTTYISRIRRKYERVGRLASSRVDLYQRAMEDGFLPAAAALADAG